MSDTRSYLNKYLASPSMPAINPDFNKEAPSSELFLENTTKMYDDAVKNESIQAKYSESRENLQNKLNDINARIVTVRNRIADMEAALKFKRDNENDPTYRAAIQQYKDTGDTSAINAYKAQKESAKANEYNRQLVASEKSMAANIEIQSAKDNIDQAIEIMKDPNYAGTPEYNAAKKQFNEAQNILKNRYGIDYKGSEAPKPKAEVPESKLKIDVLSDAEDYIEGIYEGDVSTIKEDLKALFKEYPNDKEIRDLYRKVRTAEREAPYREAYQKLSKAKPTIFNTKADRDKWNERVYNALNSKQISQAQANELISKEESGEEAKAKARSGAVSSHVGKKTGEALERNEEKKKLADKAREKQKIGRALTAAEKQALKEGY